MTTEEVFGYLEHGCNAEEIAAQAGVSVPVAKRMVREAMRAADRGAFDELNEAI